MKIVTWRSINFIDLLVGLIGKKRTALAYVGNVEKMSGEGAVGLGMGV